MEEIKSKPSPQPVRTLSDGVANPKQGGRGAPHKPKTSDRPPVGADEA